MSNVDLTFRPLSEADLEITLGWRNHPDSLRWFVDTTPISPEVQRRWFLSRVDVVNDDIFVLCVRNNQPVGQFSVYRVEPEQARAEVGRFLIDPAHRGRGYFDAGLDRLLHFARTKYRLREVYLNVRHENIRAIRAYERNGFRAISTEGEILLMRLTF